MEDAYRKYKADTEAVRLARREFNEMKAAILRPATTEGYIELAKLALLWGRKTVRYRCYLPFLGLTYTSGLTFSSLNRSSESRLKFLRTYRQAYAFEDVRGHIMRANEFLASATSAVEEAQKWYDSEFLLHQTSCKCLAVGFSEHRLMDPRRSDLARPTPTPGE
jgi:hypothetical protein